MGRPKATTRTRRAAPAPNPRSRGRIGKTRSEAPSWLPRQSQLDPVLTPSIRLLLNGRSEVSSYSDSTGTLNVEVKKRTKKKLQMQLRKDLTEELKEGDGPQKFTVKEGRPFVLCSALPLDLKAGDEKMYRKAGIYLRARLRRRNGNGNDEWTWHVISVYHLVHGMCREGHYLWDEVRHQTSPYMRMHCLGVEFKKRRDENVSLHDVVSHPEGRHSFAVLDAKKRTPPQEVTPQEATDSTRHEATLAVAIDILAIRANPGLEANIENDKTDGKLVEVNIHKGPFSAANELPEQLLALGASKGHPPYEGTVLESATTVELELAYNDEGHTEPYLYEHLLRYKFPRWTSQPDDCGTPIFTKPTNGGNPKLLAFHIARRSNGRSGLGLYAFHNINVVFPPDIWEVEAYTPRCVTDPESGYYSNSFSPG